MSSIKPQEALQLGLNILIDTSCEGCNWHEFPYEINSILFNDKRKLIRFENIKDIKNYIELLREELKEISNQGNSQYELKNIYEQLPFFVCKNKLLNEKAQKDISRYIYAADTNTPPYNGSYGDTPSIWIQKYYIIKQTMILRAEMLKEKNKKDE